MSTVADKLAKKSTRKTGGKQVRLRLVGGGAVEARVDLVERLPLTDQRAFGEEAPTDQARYLRANIRRLERGGAAGQLGDNRGVGRLHDDEADRRRGGWPARRRPLLARAAGGGGEKQGDEAWSLDCHEAFR